MDAPKPLAVRFLSQADLYNAGEVAVFPGDVAARYVASGVAEPYLEDEAPAHTPEPIVAPAPSADAPVAPEAPPVVAPEHKEG